MKYVIGNFVIVQECYFSFWMNQFFSEITNSLFLKFFKSDKSKEFDVTLNFLF